MSLREATEDLDEFISLVEWLPPESAYFAVRRANGDYGKARATFGWSFTEDVLWNVLQAILINTHTTAQAASTKRLPAVQLPDNPAVGPSESKKSDNGGASAMAKALIQAARNEAGPPES